ncbi:UNVERIFIED_CONTAM: hypothetical protein FKN15_028741 [Acipenser sinensis]
MSVRGSESTPGLGLPESESSQAQAALTTHAHSSLARSKEQTRDELEKIKRRVQHTVQAFELANNRPSLESLQQANMQFVEDMAHLEVIVGDQVNKKKYQQQMTVFIVGYQQLCGERKHILSQLNKNAKLGEEDSISTSEDMDIELDDVAMQVKDALSAAERATIRLAEISQEIISYMSSTAISNTQKRSRSRLDTAVNQAREDILQLTGKLLQTQAGRHHHLEALAFLTTSSTPKGVLSAPSSHRIRECVQLPSHTGSGSAFSSLLTQDQGVCSAPSSHGIRERVQLPHTGSGSAFSSLLTQDQEVRSAPSSHRIRKCVQLPPHTGSGSAFSSLLTQDQEVRSAPSSHRIRKCVQLPPHTGSGSAFSSLLTQDQEVRSAPSSHRIRKCVQLPPHTGSGSAFSSLLTQDQEVRSAPSSHRIRKCVQLPPHTGSGSAFSSLLTQDQEVRSAPSSHRIRKCVQLPPHTGSGSAFSSLLTQDQEVRSAPSSHRIRKCVQLPPHTGSGSAFSSLLTQDQEVRSAPSSHRIRKCVQLPPHTGSGSAFSSLLTQDQEVRSAPSSHRIRKCVQLPPHTGSGSAFSSLLTQDQEVRSAPSSHRIRKCVQLPPHTGSGSAFSSLLTQDQEVRSAPSSHRIRKCVQLPPHTGSGSAFSSLLTQDQEVRSAPSSHRIRKCVQLPPHTGSGSAFSSLLTQDQEVRSAPSSHRIRKCVQLPPHTGSGSAFSSLLTQDQEVRSAPSSHRIRKCVQLPPHTGSGSAFSSLLTQDQEVRSAPSSHRIRKCVQLPPHTGSGSAFSSLLTQDQEVRSAPSSHRIRKCVQLPPHTGSGSAFSSLLTQDQEVRSAPSSHRIRKCVQLPPHTGSGNLEYKDERLKELLKQNEAKFLESQYFRSQLETTKTTLSSVQQELGLQISMREAEVRRQAARITELERELQVRGVNQGSGQEIQPAASQDSECVQPGTSASEAAAMEEPRGQRGEGDPGSRVDIEDLKENSQLRITELQRGNMPHSPLSSCALVSELLDTERRQLEAVRQAHEAELRQLRDWHREQRRQLLVKTPEPLSRACRLCLQVYTPSSHCAAFYLSVQGAEGVPFEELDYESDFSSSEESQHSVTAELQWEQQTLFDMDPQQNDNPTNEGAENSLLPEWCVLPAEETGQPPSEGGQEHHTEGADCTGGSPSVSLDTEGTAVPKETREEAVSDQALQPNSPEPGATELDRKKEEASWGALPAEDRNAMFAVYRKEATIQIETLEAELEKLRQDSQQKTKKLKKLWKESKTKWDTLQRCLQTLLFQGLESGVSLQERQGLSECVQQARERQAVAQRDCEAARTELQRLTQKASGDQSILQSTGAQMKETPSQELKPTESPHLHRFTPCTEGSGCAARSPVKSEPESPSDPPRPGGMIMFTHLDLEHNKRALRHALRRGRVPAQLCQSACREMRMYSELQRQRLASLVRQYTTYLGMLEAREVMTTSSNSSAWHFLPRLQALHVQRLSRWSQHMAGLSEHRVQLALSITDTLGSIEEESGIFLIKPVLLWKKRETSLKHSGRIVSRLKVSMKPDPCPTLSPSSQTTASRTQLKTGEDGAVTKSHGRVSLVTVSKGCILYVWSGAELRAGGAHTFGEGTFTEEQLSDVLKEPALAYSCECEKAESLSRKKSATFEDFQECHVISPSPVPNTNEGWTQLMRERRLFGRPINTFIHGEVDQIRQAFDLQISRPLYVCMRAVVVEQPRKSFGASSSANTPASSSAGTPSKNKYAGGNSVCPRPTPTWQKGIGDFFGGPSSRPEKEKENLFPSEDEEAGGSGVGKAPRK